MWKGFLNELNKVFFHALNVLVKYFVMKTCLYSLFVHFFFLKLHYGKGFMKIALFGLSGL